ncbi:ComEC/Rec2 family competence protein [Breznakiella homolactica]|uniref:ComEC/Rec2 family competence protein n=1 Tax=Breznakiella homolactica TaxID=2798577 RepID=A0A7T7XKM2_9SPIR|nr:ComEC/Rec2 family competence protein [Breznakiella homolactica]QQO08035.1 ComEC/Rec2 family competence protein [Breznakiella homolactica]
MTARSLAAAKFYPGIPIQTISGISGLLLDDPRTFLNRSGTARLDVTGVSASGGIRAVPSGTVTVFFPEHSMPQLKEFGKNSRIYAEGRFFGADQKGIQRFEARTVYITDRPATVYRIRNTVRIEILERFSPYPWGSLAAALLLGVRDDLDRTIQNNYRDAGVSHVLALSGMHLAVISGLIAFLLSKPLGLKRAGITGAVLIGAYIFLVGPQPSLLRAAIMYFIGTAALLTGVSKESLPVLSAAFLIQLALQPAQGDEVSFILSYLALAGILVISPAFLSLCRGRIPEFLSQPLAASVGAFIATCPVVCAFFGVLRPAGIAAGLVIVPLSTVFMVGALVWLAVSFLIPPAGPVLGIILSVLYDCLGWVVSFAARFPGWEPPGLTAGIGLTLGSVLFIAAAYFQNYRSRMRFVPFN